MIFRSYLLCCIFESTSAIFVWRELRNFATDMANVENVEEMVGTREAEVVAVATESGRAVATESSGAVATESGGGATTGDATAGDETAATGGVMYEDEGPYTIDVRHVEEMVGTTREAAVGDRVRRGRNGDETGGPRDETGDKTAATTGDERDGDERWVMYMDEGELEFDEDEMASLEGQRLVAEFRCGIY